jgi:hypothetical protein
VLACVAAWRWWWAPARAARLQADVPALLDARARVHELLGVELRVHGRVDALSWRAPTDCIEVYELRIDEDFRDASVARFVGREPEHARGWLALARRDAGIVAVLISDDPNTPARRRELWWSSKAIGPSAPDFACRRRSWDPLEDALAFGWPTLPAGRVRVGDAWTGSPVEGRCHETVCLDDDGRFTHEQPCRARPWRERLAGAQDGLALIVGDWDDGHDPPAEDPPKIATGILTSRTALLDHGRPLQVWASVVHRWSGVRRSLSLTRIDDCDRRSLATPEHAEPLARAREVLDGG